MDVTMSGGGTESTESAPLVADHIGTHLLAEQVGDQETYREEEIEDVESGAESSDLSELESEEEGKQWEGKDKGRPNFKRAAVGAGQQQSTQEFFRHGNGGNNGMSDDDNFFATTGKQSMRAALARSLSAAASSPQQVESALTPNSASDSSEGAGTGGGQELNRVGSKEAGGREEANLVWAKEVASMSEDEMEDVVGPGGSTTPTPMPARWATPTPVPVTPSNGNKKRALAAGALGFTRAVPPPRRLAGIPAYGWSNGVGLAEILAAIVLAEKRMEARDVQMEKRIEERAAEREEKAEVRERWAGVREKMAQEREACLTERVGAIEKRLVEGLATLSVDMGTKAQRDQAQWESLGREMEGCRKEIAEVGRQAKLAAVAAAIETPALPLQRQHELRRQPLDPRREKRRADTLPLSIRRAAAERQQKALPPAEMKGVVMTRIEVEDIEEFSDMEGVELEGLCTSQLVATASTSARVPQEVTREEGNGGAMEGIEWEGLFASQHALGLDTPIPTLAPARTEEGGKKDKGKAKAVLSAAPPGAAASRKPKGSSRQLQRQAAVDEERKKAETHTQTPGVGPSAPARLRSILKRPETAAAEAEAAGKREEEKRKAVERRAEDGKVVVTREEVRWEEREKQEEEKLARKVEAQTRWEA